MPWRETVQFGVSKNSPRTPLNWKAAAAFGLWTGIVAFCVQVFEYTWLPPAFALTAFATGIYLAISSKRKEHTDKLAWSLKRHLGPNALAHFQKNPQQLDSRDRNVAMTIASFDIPGLKETLDAFDPTLVFPKLRDLNDRITTITHAFGGIVIPGYRNGFLCMFGDTLFTGHTNQRHAEAALQAAAEVQKTHTLAMRAAFGQKEPLLALRCGITSARGFIANIGRDEQVDFNCFGEGIGEVQALQKACDAGSILFSRITRDLMVGVDVHTEAFQKRFINDRENGETITEVYEYDPLNGSPELRAALLQAVKESAKHERQDVRWQVKNPHVILIETNVGPAEIINISRGGVGIRLQDKVTIGTVIRLTFNSTDAALKKRLENRAFTSFGMEVRWTTDKNSVFITGLAFKNVAESDREFLLQCILESKAFDTQQTA